jgi:hypothetical protein
MIKIAKKTSKTMAYNEKVSSIRVVLFSGGVQPTASRFVKAKMGNFAEMLFLELRV